MTESSHPHFDDRGTLAWHSSLEEAKAQAAREGKLIFKMDEITEYLGREMTAEIFEVNTSTHYGRMVRVDDNTVILFGDMNEVMEFI